MPYPDFTNYHEKIDLILEYARLKHEERGEGIQELLSTLSQTMEQVCEAMSALPVDPAIAQREPDGLEAIRALRPSGPRKLDLPAGDLRDKLEGAFLARMAGCTLGVPFENQPVEVMENWARYIGDPFPPTRYWSKVKQPYEIRYGVSDMLEYTLDRIHEVPVDDDVTYTLLGLLIAEEFGVDFTMADVGAAWKKYLPCACTAEDVALKNLKAGIDASAAAEHGNPYCQWIGALIRSDPYAYMAPAYPEKAAELAYRDAFLSHRRNGIYGAMFFAAAQSAAFAVDSSRAALEIGLTEIPAGCALAKDLRWALDIGDSIRDYREARKVVDDRFSGMSPVHTNNNACLTVFGLLIGGNDMTRVISETVAMGLDNDCTTATAGSIVGAIVGKRNIPSHWYERFNNRVRTYLNGQGAFAIDDIISRFMKLWPQTRKD